ncbi:MAG: hypothetical protein JNJ45_10160 [Chthonomonas sp.]|nr:hypothetical protein [Chthonomonas sp.]
MMFDGNSGKLKVIRAHKPGESVAVKNPWRPGLVNGKGIYLVHETKWYEEKPAHVPISGGSTLGGSYSSVITTWVGPKKKYSYELGTADTSSPTNKDGTWIMLSADGFFVVDNIRKSYQEVQGSKLDIQGMCMPYPWRVSP